MSFVVSSVPGRIRLRHAALLDARLLDQLKTAVVKWRHVLAVTANARVGSLLVHYDAAALDDARCAIRLETAAAKLLAEPVTPSAPRKAASSDATAHGGTPRWPLRRSAGARHLLAALVHELDSFGVNASKQQRQVQSGRIHGVATGAAVSGTYTIEPSFIR